MDVFRTGDADMFFKGDTDEPIGLTRRDKTDYAGDERRSERRHRTLKGALLNFNNGFGNLECVLRDMNSNGARISMGHTEGIPTRFTLKVSGEKKPVEALVRWRTPRDVGLSFLLRAD
jgi:hypothetical protein